MRVERAKDKKINLWCIYLSKNKKSVPNINMLCWSYCLFLILTKEINWVHISIFIFFLKQEQMFQMGNIFKKQLINQIKIYSQNKYF